MPDVHAWTEGSTKTPSACSMEMSSRAFSKATVAAWGSLTTPRERR